MASGLLGKILSGLMVAGGSVLSILAPPIGIPLLSAGIGVAGAAFSSDTVSQSGANIAAGTIGQVADSLTSAANQVTTQIQRETAYKQYVAAGYSETTAAAMADLSTSSTTGLPAWLLPVGIGLIAILLLRKLKII